MQQTHQIVIEKRDYCFTRTLLTVLLSVFLFCSLSSCQSIDDENLARLNEMTSDTVVVFGDCRGGYEIFEDFVQLLTLLEKKPSAIFMAGDLIADPGNSFQWSVFLEEIAPLERDSLLFPVAGNHDVDDVRSHRVMREAFSLEKLYYDIVHLDIHFIILDSHEPGFDGAIGPEQHNSLFGQVIQPNGAVFEEFVITKKRK